MNGVTAAALEPEKIASTETRVNLESIIVSDWNEDYCNWW